MGLRSRLKKMLGREPQTQPEPPPKRVRSRAAYRDRSARPIEHHPEPQAAPEPQAPPEPAASEPPTSEPAASPPIEKDPERQDGVWRVRFINEDQGLDVTIDCPQGEVILLVAEENGVDLPSSCMGGGCTVCAGRIVEGDVHQDDQYVLMDEDLEQGYRLLCCSSPRSDVTILTHQGDEADGG